MYNVHAFDTEIALIKNEAFRDFVRYYLTERVPQVFWTTGASASGKFHPDFAKGEGGLVRHTKAVVMFCQELMRMSTWAYMNDTRKDYAIIACICHDTCKYGKGEEVDTSAYKFHAQNAAENVADAWEGYFGNYAPYELTHAIRAHMGQWSTDKDDRPFTSIDRLVHEADYIASRSFIDIPELHEEKEENNE